MILMIFGEITLSMLLRITHDVNVISKFMNNLRHHNLELVGSILLLKNLAT